MLKRIFLILSCLIFILSSTVLTYAQQAEVVYLNGVIVSVKEDNEDHQFIEIKVTEGDRKDSILTIENIRDKDIVSNTYNVGEKVVVAQEDEDNYYILDYGRKDSLLVLFIIFLFFAFLIGGKKGLSSILAMAFSFVVIFSYLLPQIQKGSDPLFVSVIASLVIIPLTFYVSHGFCKKTTISVISTLISLIITGILVLIFTNVSHLTGTSSEDAMFLSVYMDIDYNLKNLLLAGILIGTLGVLDDITISQTSIVFQIYDLKKDISFYDLFKKSMVIGRDHIASMINTLILVYAGVSLPLLLLFTKSSNSFDYFINLEVCATEVVRTLCGSIGLILAVPITTFLACYIVLKNRAKLES